MIRKLLSDIVGVAKVSGIGRAIQWAVCVALTLPANLRSKNLLAADRLMGEGPFRVIGATGRRVVLQRITRNLGA